MVKAVQHSCTCDIHKLEMLEEQNNNNEHKKVKVNVQFLSLSIDITSMLVFIERKYKNSNNHLPNNPSHFDLLKITGVFCFFFLVPFFIKFEID